MSVDLLHTTLDIFVSSIFCFNVLKEGPKINISIFVVIKVLTPVSRAHNDNVLSIFTVETDFAPNNKGVIEYETIRVLIPDISNGLAETFLLVVTFVQEERYWIQRGC